MFDIIIVLFNLLTSVILYNYFGFSLTAVTVGFTVGIVSWMWIRTW